MTRVLVIAVLSVSLAGCSLLPESMLELVQRRPGSGVQSVPVGLVCAQDVNEQCIVASVQYFLVEYLRHSGEYRTTGPHVGTVSGWEQIHELNASIPARDRSVAEYRHTEFHFRSPGSGAPIHKIEHHGDLPRQWSGSVQLAIDRACQGAISPCWGPQEDLQ